MDNEQNKFLEDLEIISMKISQTTVQPWAVIGSSCLAVHGLVGIIPTDVNIMLSPGAMSDVAIAEQRGPVRTISPDRILAFNKLEGKMCGRDVVFISSVDFMSPTGQRVPVKVEELHTETVVRDGSRFRNIITVPEYMSLAGIFNRDKDRRQLTKLYEQSRSKISIEVHEEFEHGQTETR